MTIITARERNPFGELDPDDMKQNAMQGKDAYFIPGYSDKRMERELAIRDYQMGKSREYPAPLPYRFQIVGTMNLKGQADSRGATEFRRQGYRPVKWEEAKTLGIDLTNSSYRRAQDGTVSLNGEGMLMVCDAKQARINFEMQERAKQAAEAAPRAQMQDAIDRFNDFNGLDAKTGAQLVDVNDTKVASK